MVGKYLLGATGAAILAIASAGSAHAADVMPVVAPVVTPVVVPPPGPVFEINIETWLETEVFNNEFDPTLFAEASLKVTLPSGWGFELITELFTYILPPPDAFVAVTGRVFRSMGDVEVGVYAGAGFSLMGTSYGIGGDFAYDSDRLTVESYVQGNFAVGGGFVFLDHETDVTLHVTEMLDIYAGYDFETDFVTFDIDGYIGAQVDFGLLAPYATVWLDGGLGGEIGVELEHQFGNGPLSLLGYAEVEFGGGGPEGFVGIGIKFSRGGAD